MVTSGPVREEEDPYSSEEDREENEDIDSDHS